MVYLPPPKCNSYSVLDHNLLPELPYSLPPTYSRTQAPHPLWSLPLTLQPRHPVFWTPSNHNYNSPMYVICFFPFFKSRLHIQRGAQRRAWTHSPQDQDLSWDQELDANMTESARLPPLSYAIMNYSVT